MSVVRMPLTSPSYWLDVPSKHKTSVRASISGLVGLGDGWADCGWDEEDMEGLPLILLILSGAMREDSAKSGSSCQDTPTTSQC